MENLVFTQLSVPEVRKLFREELETFFAEKPATIQPQPNDGDEIGGVEFAANLTGYAIPTIYDLVHKRKIPHSKPEGKLNFSKKELLAWMKSKKRKTVSEIETEAAAL
ncbi:MAG TPA: helix-turn-helix domain-containing protein [Pyrinomonadaceae bacterium]|jgi:excisionase family DNA binding protein